MGYREPVPERFGQLGRLSALLFACSGCTRARQLDRAELVRRFGEEGRVRDVLARFACSNCKAKRRGGRLPPVRVSVVKVYRTRGEQMRDAMAPMDALVYDIEQMLKQPRGWID